MMNILTWIKNKNKQLRLIENQNYELIWAKTWDDTKKGIEWMEGMSGISPGREAVGYNYLYLMTRILNEKRPQRVLDLGLGISSTLISQYFQYNDIKGGGGYHDIVEENSKWAEFYAINNKISDASTIHIVDTMICEAGGYRFNVYNPTEFKNKVIKDKKYDIISIDGPRGSEHKSRRDVLDNLPQILEDSFIIIIDDVQRIGEMETYNDMMCRLKEKNINFYNSIYVGMTYCGVIVSEDNAFFCTM